MFRTSTVCLSPQKGSMQQMAAQTMMGRGSYMPGMMPQGRQFSSPNSAFSPVQGFGGTCIFCYNVCCLFVSLLIKQALYGFPSRLDWKIVDGTLSLNTNKLYGLFSIAFFPDCFYRLSDVMTKPVSAICKQQRRRSAWTSTQYDKHLFCSLPG